MNKELFKLNLKKYWVLPVIIAILLAVVIPVAVLVQKGTIESNAEQIAIESKQNKIEKGINIDENQVKETYKQAAAGTIIFNSYNVIVLLAFPLIVSIQLFKFSGKKGNNVTELIESLKIENKTVYITNIVSGLALISIPYVFNLFLLIIFKTVVGLGSLIAFNCVITWFLANIIFATVFFTFTTIIGMITKTRVTQILSTFAFMFIPIFLIYLFETVLMKTIYGFPGYAVAFLQLISEIPNIKVFQTFNFSSLIQSLTAVNGLVHFVVYLIISLIFGVIGYKLFKNDRGIKYKNVSRSILKYMGVFFIISFLYLLIVLINNIPVISMITASLIFILTYLIFKIIKNKTWKVFGTAKKYYIILGVSTLFIAICSGNLFGYETKIPDIEEVKSATYAIASNLDVTEHVKKEEIAHIMEKHKNFILEENKIKDYVNKQYKIVYIKYQLKNGESIIRNYEVEAKDAVNELVLRESNNENYMPVNEVNTQNDMVINDVSTQNNTVI